MSDITPGDGKQKTWFLWTEKGENESRVTEGLVSSVCRENTSHKGVFVLLNDRTICVVFTQTVPGSLEETDSAPERWEIILHSQPSLAALFLSQSESLRRDILSEGRRAAGLVWMGEFNNLKLARSSTSETEWKWDFLFAWNNDALLKTSSEWRAEEPWR